MPHCCRPFPLLPGSKSLTPRPHGAGLSCGLQLPSCSSLMDRCQRTLFFSMRNYGFEWPVSVAFRHNLSSLTGGRLAEAQFRKRTAMKNFATSVKKFLVSEDGPTAVEYAVMMALIIVVCIGTITTIGTNADTKFGKVRDALS